LIPIFDRILYPILGKHKSWSNFLQKLIQKLFSNNQGKCGILKTPLQKIVTGGIFVSLSFFLAAVLESKIQENARIPLSSGQSRLSIVNPLPCDFNILITQLDSQHHEYAPLHLQGILINFFHACVKARCYENPHDLSKNQFVESPFLPNLLFVKSPFLKSKDDIFTEFMIRQIPVRFKP